MPAFSRGDAFALAQLAALPGRKVFVSFSAGNDTTGDGSISAPFATMGMGATQLRNGRNDILVIVDGGISSEAPVVISGKSNISVVGLGFPQIRPPTGRVASTAVTSWTSASVATVASGHGFVAGDYVMVHGTASGGVGGRTRGLARVGSSAATTLTLQFLQLFPGSPPVTGGAQGRITSVPLVIEGASNVLVSGLRFTTAAFSDAWSGLGISAGTAAVGKNILVADCSFVAGALAVGGFPPSVTNDFDGSNIKIERNNFTLLTVTAFLPNHGLYGALYLGPAVQVEALENLFQRNDGSGAAMAADAAIHLSNDPLFSIAFVNNRFDGDPATSRGIPLNRIMRVQPNNVPLRIFAQGNFYTHATIPGGGENFSIEVADLIRERFAVSFPSQDLIPTQIEVVRRGAGILATFRVTGGSALAIQTTATQADGWFTGARIVVYGSGGAAFGITHEYNAASGAFTLEQPLPFTPAVGDPLLVLGTDDPHSLLDHPLAGHAIAGTVGEALGNADVPTSTRAAPGDAMDLVTDAVDAGAVATSGAQEIAAEVEADLSATHGAGSWATATGFSTPADVAAAETAILAAVAALNDLSVADVQSALTAHGYTSARAVFLDALDVAVSTRATPADIAASEASVLAAIGALTDLSIADVQTALTNQGYTSARSLLLDALDVAVSTRAAPGAAMDLVVDALDSDAVAASGAAEIAAAVTPAPSAGDVADAVLDEVVDGHLGAGSVGEALSFARAAAAGRVRLSTANPAQWVLEVYAEDGSTVLRTLNLTDQAGAPITSTNNPLADSAVLFADRVPV